MISFGTDKDLVIETIETLFQRTLENPQTYLCLHSVVFQPIATSTLDFAPTCFLVFKNRRTDDKGFHKGDNSS